MMPCYSVTDRFVLHAGYACNMRCEFCYYLDDLKKNKTKDYSTSENKKRIDFAFNLGKRAIDISGGEPTIRKDLPELISYCKDKEYHTVTIITNGIKTNGSSYSNQLKEAGLDEGLFSIHSHDQSIHDSLTHVKGSFTKLLNSIENFKKLNLKIRINTVITNINYKYINEFLRLVYPFKPETVNLIVFNPSETTIKLSKQSRVRFSDYQVIGDAISYAIDEWKDKIKIINVRFLPFCFLKKHPQNIRTQWQKFHEDQEWDPFLNALYQKGPFLTYNSIALGTFLSWNTPRYESANKATTLSRKLSAFRMKYFYKQNSICHKKCSLSPICTGIQTDYVKQFGFPEFDPVELKEKKIYDPLYYVKDLVSIFNSLRY